ncbi:hypothetical protein [Paraburkholderia terrae]|uniref:hypothetical protein n=1 Tax=Paraburkholderia terrae TaxID=311230 RepID=UPI0020BE152D|nr:hypothetical protein [Paraburkholderia terrae]
MTNRPSLLGFFLVAIQISLSCYQGNGTFGAKYGGSHSLSRPQKGFEGQRISRDCEIAHITDLFAIPG